MLLSISIFYQCHRWLVMMLQESEALNRQKAILKNDHASWSTCAKKINNNNRLCTTKKKEEEERGDTSLATDNINRATSVDNDCELSKIWKLISNGKKWSEEKVVANCNDDDSNDDGQFFQILETARRFIDIHDVRHCDIPIATCCWSIHRHRWAAQNAVANGFYFLRFFSLCFFRLFWEI